MYYLKRRNRRNTTYLHVTVCRGVTDAPAAIVAHADAPAALDTICSHVQGLQADLLRADLLRADLLRADLLWALGRGVVSTSSSANTITTRTVYSRLACKKAVERV